MMFKSLKKLWRKRKAKAYKVRIYNEKLDSMPEAYKPQVENREISPYQEYKMPEKFEP